MSSIDYPFISIVIPTKNEEKFIERCLDGVLALNYPKESLEIIVIDNHSSDSTVKKLRKYQSVRLFEKMGYVSSVRNFGASQCKGMMLAFLDGDSVPDPNWLKRGCEFFAKDSSVGCVGFAIAEPLPSASWVEKSWYKIGSGSKHQGTCTVKWLSSFNLLIKREFFERVGGFDESLETCEDADLGHRLNEICKLIYSNDIKILHLANASTLGEFFSKEIWRGKGNLKSFFNAPNKIGNVLSVFLPLFYFLGWIVWAVTVEFAILQGESSFLFFAIFVLLLFIPFVLTLRKKIVFQYFFKVYILYFVYLYARGIALIKYFLGFK